MLFVVILLILMFTLYSYNALMGFWNHETNSIDKYALLRLDTKKVWKEDDSEFVVEGNRSYESTIQEFSYISNGNFQPKDIKETWESRDRIKITFYINDKQHVIYPKVVSDWADIDGIVKYLNNQILNGSDFKFYGGRISDVFIIGLTNEERESLEREVGVKFREIE